MTIGERVDVLVIGAGAAGAAVAWMLARAGIGVTCLEQGDWVDPKAYPHWQPDWELHRHTDWSPEPNVRGLPQDYPVNDAASAIAPLMYNAVGGSTIHWSAHFPRLRPSDFRVRSLDGVADDWPVDYAALEPFFDLNDRMMGVAGIAGDPAYPPKPPRQTPPIALDTLGVTMARGFDRLGWHWWPSDSAIITRDYDGRRACNNCGPCDLGCPIGAKASTDITYWPKALALGARLVTRARVREITVGPDGRADGVLYHDREGRVVEQKARAVVLAANGIGTPRLLLNSRSAQFPDGLANRNGLVGRNLMFHPYAIVRGVFDEPLGGHRGPIGCSIISQEFYETDLSRGFVRGYSFQVSRGLSAISTATGGLVGDRVPWGREHRRAYDGRFDRTIGVAVIGEDLPEAHNRVDLDPGLTDSDGVPAPRVSYTLSDNSRRMLEHGADRAREALLAAGARAVEVNLLLRAGGWHLMGTARMGTDPATSVIDAEGRCHDVSNLYIVDGSAMVTSGGVNPTSTLQAVALYIADGMIPEARVTLTAEHALLIPILDTLVPPSGNFPGAGTVALDHILAAAASSPDLDALLSRALHATMGEAAGANRFTAMSEDDRETVLRRVEQSQPEAFTALVRHTYFGYYSHPTVIMALGLDHTPVQPRGHHPDPVDLPDLARVTARGPIYRTT